MKDIQLPRLYAVTDRRLIHKSLSEDIAEAIEGGAKMIQLREKNVTEEEYEAAAEEALAVCRSMGAILIINDNIEVCRRTGSDGVHLGQGDADPKTARRILGEDALIGVTAKTPEQVKKAMEDGADYIGSGAVFGTKTKSDAAPMSMERLRAVTAVSALPVYAIGGIDPGNAHLLRGTGVYGIASVSGVFSGDIRKNAEALAKEALLL